MSAGPIAQWRESWKPTTVSTTDAARVCRAAGRAGYCGRRPKALTDDWSKVTCADCLAAAVADGVLDETTGRAN